MNNFKLVGQSISNLQSRDEVMNHITQNSLTKSKRKYIFSYKAKLACIIVLFFFFSSTTAYAISSDFRYFLYDKFSIGKDDTHEVNVSCESNGIIMTVLSTRVTGKTATVLLSFTQENNKPFSHSMTISNSVLNYSNRKEHFKSVVSELSSNKKALLSCCTWNIDNLQEQDINLTIENLSCNESLELDQSPEDIRGKWTLDFQLNRDSELHTFINNSNKTVTINNKKLKITSVSVSDLSVVVDTDLLENVTPPATSISQALYSPYSILTGEYYNVFIKITYQNGTVITNESSTLDENNNIYAIFDKKISLNQIKEIAVGDITIPATH